MNESYELFVDRSADPADIAAMTQDEIENDIEAMVREGCLDNEPDATEAEIGQAREFAAAEILSEAKRLAGIED